MPSISNNIHNLANAAYNKASQVSNFQTENFEDSLKQAQNQFNQNIQNSFRINTLSTENSSWLGGIVTNGLKNLSKIFKKAETVSNQSLIDNVDLVDLMTSLNEAEIALKTTQAIRDKIISAYLEIFKMPI